MIIDTKDIKRFWKRVNKQGHYPHKNATVKTRCYEYIGHTVNGYGQIDVNYVRYQAHRFMYLLAYGLNSLKGLGPDGRHGYKERTRKGH